MTATIDRGRLRDALRREEDRFLATHPRSQALFERAKRSLLAGVPMSWMVRWAGGFPIFATLARALISRTSTGTDTSTCVSGTRER